MCLHAFSRRKTAKLREAQSARFGKASESCALTRTRSADRRDAARVPRTVTCRSRLCRAEPVIAGLSVVSVKRTFGNNCLSPSEAHGFHLLRIARAKNLLIVGLSLRRPPPSDIAPSAFPDC
jgi:hypothetical protein